MRWVVALALAAGCGIPALPDAGVDAGPAARRPGREVLADGGQGDVIIPGALSALALFRPVPIVDGRVQPEADLVPYELSTALFSDHAAKTRTLLVPGGTAATYVDREVLDFPVGTIITKTFSFPADLRAPDRELTVVETRLLVRQPAGWAAYPFVWNEEGTEATWAPGGRVKELSVVGHDGGVLAFQYAVPSANQCQECHHVKGEGSEQVLVPIGVKARYLDFATEVDGDAENQLERLARRGVLAGLPPRGQRPRVVHAFTPSSGSLEERARTYLDINCAHCHRPEATAGDTSNLFLDIFNESRFNLGECKRPGSAGNDVGGEFDIVPGDHRRSILWFRLQTVESGKMMPAIGRALRHDEGADLVAAWIDSLPPRSCKEP